MSYQATILADHPHAYYPLNDAPGSATAADASGNGYTGTYGTSGLTIGVASALPGDTADTGVTSAGTGGIVSLPSGAAPATGSSPWSLECWVAPQTASLDSGYHALVAFGTNAHAEMAGLYLHGGSAIFTGYADDSTPGAALTAGSLHHAVVTYDGATATVYVDGAIVTAFAAGTLNISVSGVQIGRNVTGNYDHLAATLYHVAVYNYALSAAQVTSHYSAGITVVTVSVPTATAASGPLPFVPPVVPPAIYTAPPAGVTGTIYAVINGEVVTIQHGSLHITRQVGQRSTGSMVVIDLANTQRYKQGTPFTIYDQSGRRVWCGVVMADQRARSVKGGDVAHSLTLADWHYLADKRTAAYTHAGGVTADVIVRDVINQYLGYEGVTAGTITTGPTISGTVVCAYAPVSSLLDALVQKCGDGWYWTIDDDKRLQFTQTTSAPLAPFVADEDVMEMDSLTPAHGNPNYANSVYVVGGTAQTATQTEHRTGDGKATAFVFSYAIQSVTSLTLNGTAQTVGIQGKDTGKQWYYTPGANTLSQDTTGTPISNTDDLALTYIGQYPNVAISTDGGAVTAQQTREGVGSGLVETAIVDTTLTSTDQAFQSAAGYLSKYAQDLDTLTFLTSEYGLAEGQLLTVDDPADDFDNEQMLIEQVDITDTGPVGGEIGTIWYAVKAVSGPINTGWQAFFKKLASQGQVVIDSISVGQSQTVAVLASLTATWGWAASLTATAYACPVFPLTLSPATLC